MNGRQGVTALVSFSFIVCHCRYPLSKYGARLPMKDIPQSLCQYTISIFADLAACFRIIEKISLSPSQECKMEAHAMAIRRKIFF
jgi:hypothetical protein